MCQGNCNCNCDQITIPSIQGPQGDNGLNAFTLTTASFVVPAIGANVTLAVSNTNPYTGAWAIQGQTIYIKGAGYYEVISSTSTSIVCQNLGIRGNTTPGATVTANKQVSPAGPAILNTSVIKYNYFNANAGTGAWQLFNGSSHSLYYVDYALSQNGDTININTVIVGSVSIGSTSSLRLSLDGNVLFTIPTSNIPPAFGSVITFDINVTRVTNTTVMYTGSYTVSSLIGLINTSSNTLVYNISSLSPLTVADLDSSGNYPLAIEPEVNSSVIWTLLTQRITSIKA